MPLWEIVVAEEVKGSGGAGAQGGENLFDQAPGGGSTLAGKSLKGPVNVIRLNPKITFVVLAFLIFVAGVMFWNVSEMDGGARNPDEPVPPVEGEKKEVGSAMVPTDEAGPERGVPGATAIAALAAASGGVGEVPVAGVDQGARDAVMAEAATAHPGTSIGGAVPNGGQPVEKPKSPAELAREARRAMLDKAAQTGVGDAAGGGGLMAAAQQALGGSGLIPAAQGAPMARAGGGDAGDDPNLQKRKERYLKDAQADGSPANYLTSTRVPAMSPFEVKAGSVLPAVMVGGLNSDLPGMIKAQIRENVYDTATGRHLLIPAWSMLIGTYDSQVAFGQSRVLAVWQRVQFPDGSELALGGMPGADQAGNAGMEGEVNNHYGRALGGAVLVSLIAAGVQLSIPEQQLQQSSSGSPTVSQTLTQQLGQQIGALGNTIANKMLQVQPTIKIAPGTRFNVMVSKNMVLPRAWKW